MENKNQSRELVKANESQPSSLSKSVPWSAKDQASLAVVLGRVFDMQKQFGKKSEQLQTLVEGFCWALQPYSVQEVIGGIGEYIRNKPDMPTPSDIRHIIDPIKPVWAPDWKYYAVLKELVKNEGAYAISREEAEYCSACEEFALEKRRG